MGFHMKTQIWFLRTWRYIGIGFRLKVLGFKVTLPPKETIKGG